MVHSQAISQDAGDGVFEAVELGERVLTNGNEKARPNTPVDRFGELPCEPALAVLVRVVEKIFFELIQDDKEIAVKLGAHPIQLFHKPAQNLLRDLLAEDAAEPAARIVPPRAEHDDSEFRSAELLQVPLGQLAKVGGHSGIQERALADAARPVQHRQRRGQQVGGDDLRLFVAAEEKWGLSFRERHQPCVRPVVHAICSAALISRVRP